MKRKIERQGRILTNEELRGVLGGTDNLPPNSGGNGSGQQADARAQVIETGAS